MDLSKLRALRRVLQAVPPFARPSTLLVVVALLMACGSDPIIPDEPGRAGDGKLAEALEFVRDAHDLPALAGMIVHKGGIVEVAAVGTRVAAGSELVTVDDLWHIGSITKSMTATVVARLVERGELSWSTTVSQALPDLIGEMRSEYADVTLAELMSHTAGLREEIHEVPIWQRLSVDVGPGTGEERHEWAAQLLMLDPMSRGEHLYTNAGYIVAGAMLEAISGRSWEMLLEQEVFEPLGITTGGFGAPGRSGIRDQPWGHSREGGNWIPLPPGPGADNPAAIGPAGTVHISMADLALYALAHLEGAQGNGGLLEHESFERLHTAAPGTAYAKGWGLAEQPWTGGVALAHTGSNNRWYARLWLAPERDFGFFTVTNAAGDPGEDGTDAAAVLLIERFGAAFGG
jgi:CubicO group peptidase (beta-lactamase class C family)